LEAQLTSSFRDRFQCDLIDKREDPRPGLYGIMMMWIMVVKDHYTRLTVLRALANKDSKSVAFELNMIIGLVGYPLVYQSDNGGEVHGAEVLKIVRSHNPDVFTVHGRPRTPRDQGSVERQNLTIKNILSTLQRTQQEKDEVDSWVSLLGQTMGQMNGSSNRNCAESSYHHVFGMDYHAPRASVSRDELRRVETLPQLNRLLNSPEFSKRFADDFMLEDDDEDVASEQPEQKPPTQTKKVLFSDDDDFVLPTQSSSSSDDSNEQGDNKANSCIVPVERALAYFQAFRKSRTLSTDWGREYTYTNARLSCPVCLKTDRSYYPIDITEERFWEALRKNGKWMQRSMVQSFCFLLLHSLHLCDTLYIGDCRNAPENRQALLQAEVTRFRHPNEIRTIHATGYEGKHYAVITLYVRSKRIVVQDGYFPSLISWKQTIEWTLWKLDTTTVQDLDTVDYISNNGRPLSLTTVACLPASSVWQCHLGEAISQAGNSTECGFLKCVNIWQAVDPNPPAVKIFQEARSIVIDKYQDLVRNSSASGHLTVSFRNKKQLCPLSPIAVEVLATHQGRLSTSNNACTVLSSYIALRHIRDAEDTNSFDSNDRLNCFIDSADVQVWSDTVRAKQGQQLSVKTYMDPIISLEEVMSAVFGSSILVDGHQREKMHLGCVSGTSTVQLLSQLKDFFEDAQFFSHKLAALFFFREHQVTLLRIKHATKDDFQFNLIETLQRFGTGAARICFLSLESLVLFLYEKFHLGTQEIISLEADETTSQAMLQHGDSYTVTKLCSITGYASTCTHCNKMIDRYADEHFCTQCKQRFHNECLLPVAVFGTSLSPPCPICHLTQAGNAANPNESESAANPNESESSRKPPQLSTPLRGRRMRKQASDEKAHARQEHQATLMKQRHGKSIKVEPGSIIRIHPTKQEMAFGVTTRVLGAVFFQDPKTHSLHVVTTEGIVAGANKRPRGLGVESYGVLPVNAAVSPDLQVLRKLIVDDKFVPSEYPMRSLATIQKLYFKLRGNFVGRSSCKCRSGCAGNRCGCVKLNRPCSSSCQCRFDGKKCQNPHGCG
jgi:hypothetical protein